MGVVGFLTGTTLLITYFTVSILLGLAGIAVMATSTFAIAHNFRLLARAPKSRPEPHSDSSVVGRSMFPSCITPW